MAERVLRWAGPVALVLMMFRVVQAAAKPPSNGDTWFHLRLGEELGAPWDWRNVEHWSMFATSDWVPTQPVPELLMSGVEGVLGVPGVAWLYGFGLVVFLLVVYGVSRSRSTPLVAGLVTGLALVGAAGSLSARPQLVSLILLPLVVHAWLGTERDLKPRWWLIPLTWVWTMCHGFWVIGVLVGACFCLGLVAGRSVRGGGALRLAAVPVGSLLVAALTPLGPGVVLAPLTVNERAELITEWQRTSFLTPQPWPAVVMVVAAAVLLVAGRQLTISRGLLLAMSVGWILLSIRTVDVAAVIAAPLLALALQSVVARSTEHDQARREITGLTVVGAVFLVGLALVVPRTADHAGAVPNDLQSELSGLPAGTTVFNDPALGGWLAWQHEHLNVVVDGMFDAYPVSHLEAVRDAARGEPGGVEFVDQTGARVALLDERVALVAALVEDGWVQLGDDEGYVMLGAPQLRR